MTKKHYTAIAAAIKPVLEAEKETSKELVTFSECIAQRLADYFATDNKNFDRARFLVACGVGETCRHCGEYHTYGIMHECPDNR